MTHLRQKMIEDMQLRGLSEKTQQIYVHAVRQFNWQNTMEYLPTRSAKMRSANIFSISRTPGKLQAVPCESH